MYHLGRFPDTVHETVYTLVAFNSELLSLDFVFRLCHEESSGRYNQLYC